MRRFNISASFVLSSLALLSSPTAWSAAVTKMVITSAPQTVVVGNCSAAVTVTAENSNSQPVNVRKNTTLYFDQGDPSLKIYKDSACSTAASTLKMLAGTSRKTFFFKGTVAGSKNLKVSTLNYVDGNQSETITSSPSPSPTPTVSPTSTASPSPSPSPSSSPSANRVYGVTIANPWGQLPAILTSLKSLAFKPTARVVFDENVPASEYQSPVSQIHGVSFVMGELLDSFYVKRYSVAQYTQRTTEYLNALGGNVDIWEVGNEINGEWLGNNADVVAKMSGAYDLVKAQGKKAALTLYYNQGCWSNSANEMFTWANANVPARMKQGLDYVLVSFYEDDCNGISPDWPAVFQKLGTMFPNSLIGFGETGTIYSAKKETYINRYYKLHIDHPRYIYGDFWWYFDMSQNGGAGDMVPGTSYLWGVLNQAIQSP